MILLMQVIYGFASLVGLAALVALPFAKRLPRKTVPLVAAIAALGAAYHGAMVITAVVEFGLSRYLVPLWPLAISIWAISLFGVASLAQKVRFVRQNRESSNSGIRGRKTGRACRLRPAPADSTRSQVTAPALACKRPLANDLHRVRTKRIRLLPGCLLVEHPLGEERCTGVPSHYPRVRAVQFGPICGFKDIRVVEATESSHMWLSCWSSSLRLAKP